MNKLKEINRALYEDLYDRPRKDKLPKENFGGLNFCQLIRPKGKGKVSVTGRYDPVLKDAHGGKGAFLRLAPGEGGLRAEESDDFSDYYYGASPKIDESMMLRYISELSFGSEREFSEFFASERRIYREFALHCGDEKYLLPVAKHIFLSICANFGIVVRFYDKALVRKLKENSPFLTVEDKGEFFECAICGCPPTELLDTLSEFVFVPERDDGAPSFRAVSRSEGNYPIAYEIREVYKLPAAVHNVKAQKSDVFYSGVLFRPLRLSLAKASNKNILPLIVDFERSTYGTVFTFDNRYVAHPYMDAESGRLVEEFFRKDDEQRDRLYEALNPEKINDEEYNDVLIGRINEYLEKSTNVNQICVACDITSRDGYSLYCKRSPRAIDNGTFYPSVNGNAEIADADVEFYKRSVYEDYPVVDLCDKRIDFNGELSREVNEELGITLWDYKWECYGLGILGLVKSDSPRRRMHFTMVTHQNCDMRLSEIRERQRTATENYENRELRGIKIMSYRRHPLLSAVGSFLKTAASFLLKAKNIILSVFTLLTFFSVLKLGNITFSSLETIFSGIFAILVILYAIYEIILFCKRDRNNRPRTFIITIKSSFESKVTKLSYKWSKKFLGKTIYPITKLLMYCYIYDINA